MFRKMWKSVFMVMLLLTLCFSFTTSVRGDDGDSVLDEELGIDPPAPDPDPNPNKRNIWNNEKLAVPRLLIPDSTTDTVGLYFVTNGDYLGDLITGFDRFSTPINAVLGPDGLIYVSDQVADSIFVFFQNGNYLFTYADASDGLNNIRGIDFRDGHLFVTSGDDYVAEFQGPHDRLPDFISDGSDPFDILFLPDGKSILCDIGGDKMRLYDVDGSLIGDLFDSDFPEQVVFDSVLPGAYLVNSFSDDIVSDFEEDGTVVEVTPAGDRGVYRLENGNLLVTSGSGVFEIEPVTGDIIEQKYDGSNRFIEVFEPMEGVHLWTDTNELPSRETTQIHFKLEAGSSNAGLNYIILGSVSGIHPGTPLPGGAILPLNWDYFTDVVFSMANTSLFHDFMGKLDENGKASAVLISCWAEPTPNCIGVIMHFAYVVNFPWDASNPVEIEIVP